MPCTVNHNNLPQFSSLRDLPSIQLSHKTILPLQLRIFHHSAALLSTVFFCVENLQTIPKTKSSVAMLPVCSNYISFLLSLDIVSLCSNTVGPALCLRFWCPLSNCQHTDYTASNGSRTDLEGNHYGLIEVLSQSWPGGTKENYKIWAEHLPNTSAIAATPGSVGLPADCSVKFTSILQLVYCKAIFTVLVQCITSLLNETDSTSTIIMFKMQTDINFEGIWAITKF